MRSVKVAQMRTSNAAMELCSFVQLLTQLFQVLIDQCRRLGPILSRLIWSRVKRASSFWHLILRARDFRLFSVIDIVKAIDRNSFIQIEFLNIFGIRCRRDLRFATLQRERERTNLRIFSSPPPLLSSLSSFFFSVSFSFFFFLLLVFAFFCFFFCFSAQLSHYPPAREIFPSRSFTREYFSVISPCHGFFSHRFRVSRIIAEYCDENSVKTIIEASVLRQNERNSIRRCTRKILHGIFLIYYVYAFYMSP